MGSCSLPSSQGAMARLCFLVLFVLSTFSSNSSANTLRVERDICEEKIKEANICRDSAFRDFETALSAGPDGRPDWLARKSCNYITAAIEDCSNEQIGVCFSQDEVNRMRDEQIPEILEKISHSIKTWDSEKCPAIKNHLERMNRAESEEEEDDEAEDDEAEDEEAEDEESKDEEAEDAEEQNEAPQSGSEGAAASLSIVIVLYKICSA